MSDNNIGNTVYDFYQRLHFNEGEDLSADIKTIRSGALVNAQLLPTFKQFLSGLNESGSAGLLEVGCGVGWLALACNHRFRNLTVTAIDFSDRALARANTLKSASDLPPAFMKTNILDSEAMKQLGTYDALISIGVLHHTGDFEKALKNTLERLKPDGHLMIGLYHAHRRRPLLDHFENMVKNSATEKQLREEYRRLDSRTYDQLRQESWFQDQVMHPHETQHTVNEVLALAGEAYQHISNSITGEALPNQDKLERIEARQEIVGQKNLLSGHYDPGFFLVHLKRKIQ